ncbi:MAG: hypothetical protein KC656_30470 [Myxococcales bacterium]|nr:hypothetical protein [Myxococcales bacterium]
MGRHLTRLGLLLAVACGGPPDPCAIDGAPTDLDGLFGHLDALGPSVEATCLVRSLERPLQLTATSNPFSAQPAEGPRNPRIFVHSGDLVLSLVPAGYGATVLEASERIEPGWSRKAELALPVVTAGARQEAFARTANPEPPGSRCGDCHPGERDYSAAEPEAGWVSRALAPEALTVVPIEDLEVYARDCVPGVEARCDVLSALFEDDVEEAQFPDDYRPLPEI